jgi:hypothetical protein
MTRQRTTSEEKLAMWQTLIIHYQGDRTNCPFSQHKSYIWKSTDKDAPLETLTSIIKQERI